jgi:hypothetical protein
MWWVHISSGNHIDGDDEPMLLAILMIRQLSLKNFSNCINQHPPKSNSSFHELMEVEPQQKTKAFALFLQLQNACLYLN